MVLVCVFVVLRMINAKAWQKPIVFVKIILGGLKRYLVHIFKYRTEVKTDLVAACEREFFWSSLVSPLYFIKQLLFS